MSPRVTAHAFTVACPHLSNLDRLDGLHCTPCADHSQQQWHAEVDRESNAAALVTVGVLCALAGIVAGLWQVVTGPAHLLAALFLLGALTWAFTVLGAVAIDHHRHGMTRVRGQRTGTDTSVRTRP